MSINNRFKWQIVAAAVIIATVFLVSGCSKGNSNDKNQYKIKNPELKEEIYRLQHEMTERNLTEADTVRIQQLNSDLVEAFYMKEFAWLVLHNESDHYNHPLTFLDWYVRHGEENFCAPHQLGHLAAYIEEGDVAYAEETFSVVKQKIPLWEERQELNRQKYPQFYKLASELKPMISEAISRLGRKDYGNETLELLEQIDLKSVC